MNLTKKGHHVENHSTSDIDIETTEAPKRGLTRRQVATGAAWAAPVVALAVATPFAAASATNPKTGISISNSGNIAISSNTTGGAVSGSFSGSATVSNVGSGFPITDVDASFSLSGPVVPSLFKFNGSVITGTTITSGAYTWSVVTNVPGTLELDLLSPKPIAVPADGSVAVPLPVISYATTLTSPATSTPSNRVIADAAATVYSNDDSLYNLNRKRYPSGS